MRLDGRWTSSLATGGGICAALGAATCCALPLGLLSAGLSASWLSSVTPIFAPYRDVLLWSGIALLGVGALLFGRQIAGRSSCVEEAACGGPLYRGATLFGLLLGVAVALGVIVYG